MCICGVWQLTKRFLWGLAVNISVFVEFCIFIGFVSVGFSKRTHCGRASSCLDPGLKMGFNVILENIFSMVLICMG